MNTVRSLINLIAEYTDFDTSHYIASSIVLPLEDESMYHFSTKTDADVKNEICISLGNTLSTFKHGHIHTVHCCLPREFVTSDLDKYRDHRDPTMYKFWLPERIFNSILHDHPIDIKRMMNIAETRYIQFGYEWDTREKYSATVDRLLGRC